MAIDTRQRRESAALVGLPFRGLLPVPDSTIGEDDRRQVGFIYSSSDLLDVVGVFGGEGYVIVGRASSPVTLTGQSRTDLSIVGRASSPVTITGQV